MTLAGLPNAGKSSLLNYFAGYEAAIVTDIEGTTRDVLREHISLKGVPVRISDTAGLRESDNPVELEGIRRAWDVIGKADVVLYLIDAKSGKSAADEQIIDRLRGDNLQIVYNKSDLMPENAPRDPEAIYISALNGDGLEKLIERVTGRISDYNQDNQAFMARRRHVDALQRAGASIREATTTFETTRSGELMAEDLRAAQNHLNEITGDFTSEDLLGRIFSTFCIGK